jgi:hypothetical protein
MRPTGRQFYEDRAGKRFVVYRSGGGSERKTSVRYGAKRTRGEARARAEIVASWAAAWPRTRVKQLVFTPNGRSRSAE